MIKKSLKLLKENGARQFKEGSNSGKTRNIDSRERKFERDTTHPDQKIKRWDGKEIPQVLKENGARQFEEGSKSEWKDKEHRRQRKKNGERNNGPRPENKEELEWQRNPTSS